MVDTNVLSAGAPTKAVTAGALLGWMERNSSDLFVSVITIAEVEAGIARSARMGAAAKAVRLRAWLDLVLHLYGERVLPLDLVAARLVGVLADRARALGQAPGFEDLAIAAIAQVRGLTVLTRNLRHFEGLGGAVLDPFAALPPDRDPRA